MKVAEHTIEDAPDLEVDPQAPHIEDEGDSWQTQAYDRYLRARMWVQDNPMQALGIAVATGFVAGRVFRK
jgi:ElaB/YqjD/DUF883 family membrane-anchored ribosome-binding protein